MIYFQSYLFFIFQIKGLGKFSFLYIVQPSSLLLSFEGDGGNRVHLFHYFILNVFSEVLFGGGGPLIVHDTNPSGSAT